MPRYFFHVHQGKPETDTLGVELAGIPEARAHAIEAASHMLHDRVGRATEWRMHVTDSAAATVLKLRFSSDGIDIGGDIAEPFGDYAVSPEEERLLRLFRAVDTDELKDTILELLEHLSDDLDPGRSRP